MMDGPGDYFLVEGPEVLHGAAAAPDDHHVDLAVAVEFPDPLGDLPGRSLPLDLHRVDEELHVGEAPVENIEYIVDRRAGGRGDPAYPLGLQVFDDELVLAARLEERQPPPHDEPHAVLRPEPERPGRGAEHDA